MSDPHSAGQAGGNADAGPVSLSNGATLPLGIGDCNNSFSVDSAGLLERRLRQAALTRQPS